MANEYHSRFYHRYYEGFTEKEQLDESGNKKINRLYTGTYYSPDLSAAERKKHKAASVLFYLLSLACYVCAAIQRVSINSVWYIALLQTGVLMGCLWLAWLMYYHLTAKEKMTVRIYKDASLRFRQVSLGVALFLFGIVIFSMFYIMKESPAELRRVLGTLVCYAASGTFMFLMQGYEKRVSYLTIENETKKPEKGVTIRY